MAEYNIEEEHYDTFSKAFHYFSNMFGLVNWEIHLHKQCNVEEISGERATWRAIAHGSYNDHLAVVVLADLWDVEPTHYWLSRVAFHEVWEVLFWPISEKLPKSVTHSFVHALIRLLENTFFDMLYDSETEEDDDFEIE